MVIPNHVHLFLSQKYYSRIIGYLIHMPFGDSIVYLELVQASNSNWDHRDKMQHQGLVANHSNQLKLVRAAFVNKCR